MGLFDIFSSALKKAKTAEARGNYKLAAEYYAKAKQIEKVGEMWELIGDNPADSELMRINNYRKALRWYQEEENLQKVFGKLGEMMERLAYHRNNDRYKLLEAAEYYGKAEHWEKAAKIYEQLGEKDKAIDAYEEAGNLFADATTLEEHNTWDEKFKQEYYSKIEELLENKEYLLALEEINEALSHYPENVRLVNWQKETKKLQTIENLLKSIENLWENNLLEKALEILEKLYKITPKNNIIKLWEKKIYNKLAQYHYELALTYQKENALKEAIEHLEKALQFNPDSEIGKLLVSLQAQVKFQNRFDRAKKLYEEGEEQAAELELEALIQLAPTFTIAAKLLNTIRTQKETIETIYNKAIILLESGERIEGIRILERLVTDYPNYKRAKKRLNEAQIYLHPQQKGRLVIHNGTQANRIWYIFAIPNLAIGRRDVNNIILTDLDISREHSILKYREGNLIIEDLKSRNGTRLNGERIKNPTILKNGDIIGIGRTARIVCRLQYTDFTIQPTIEQFFNIPSAPNSPSILESAQFEIIDGQEKGMICCMIFHNITIGSSPSCGLILSELTSKYARILHNDHKFWIEPLIKEATIYLNKHLINDNRLLAYGDRLKLGDVEMTYAGI